jgi:cyclopropane fatty-acyl-phospholipid synthase-like methyltransferase
MKQPIPLLATETTNSVLPMASETQLLSRAARLRAKPASQHNETGRTHGMPFIFWLLEQSKVALVAVPTVTAALALGVSGFGFTPMGALVFGVAWIAVPICGVVLPLMYLVYRSHRADSSKADWSEFFGFKDLSQGAHWQGKKIPMEIFYEAYMAGKIDFKQDVYEVMLRRNQLFQFCFTWGDVKFYFREFLGQNVTHSLDSDRGDIAHVYDRGNDFYNWFLGETMVYTSGIFRNPEESLEAAQERKLATVCQYVQMKPGDKHLDIGCGWGPLITYAAEHHGSHSTGITLSKEQAAWATLRAEKAGVSDKVRILVDDYRNLPSEKFDKITCLEMAEHVGIKNFQKFLLQVRSMLKDDGIFYLQIAGLRRSWQFEDLVWGLFMAKYIFPGADASCPLGFVTSQAERAGFEIHRVENCGVHYAVTIHKWYENWKKNEAAIVEKYGQRWFRMWMMFLSWSVLIGGQGSSTVFMVTMSKNIRNDKSTVSPDEAKQVAYSRRDRWIGPRPVATQQ